MEYHWIDPEQDRRLQAGEAEEGEMADKRLAIACILCDRANLEAVKAALGVTEVSDAVALVVSEERGEVTLAQAGRLSNPLTQDRLERILSNVLSQ